MRLNSKIHTATLVAGLLAASAALTPAATLTFVGESPTTNSMLTGLTKITASGQSNITTYAAVEIRKGRGIALWPVFVSTNASTAQVGVSYVLSPDGVTYQTDRPLWQICTFNGATKVVGYTNFCADLVDNAKTIKVLQVTNGHDATLFLTNVVASFF